MLYTLHPTPLLSSHQPDVLIVDVKMAEMDGILVVRKLKKGGTKSAILALSGYDNEGHVLAMLRAGATGFVLKDELPETLVVAVKTVAGGNSWISRSIAGPVMRAMTNDLPDSTGLSRGSFGIGLSSWCLCGGGEQTTESQR